MTHKLLIQVAELCQKYPYLESRLVKALSIVIEGRVKYAKHAYANLGIMCWIVRNGKGRAYEVVMNNNEIMTCPCKDSELFKSPRLPRNIDQSLCKHVMAVEIKLFIQGKAQSILGEETSE